MTRRTLLLTILLAAAAHGAHAQDAQRTFVFVHGAWGGGWAWGGIDSMLTAAGHRAYRPTLTGLGERVHLARADTDLTTHITDVVNHLVFERLEDVILVGHSYGGMVAMGVADRVPERIRRVVLLDAFLPEDGESVVTAAEGMRPLVRDEAEGAQDSLIVPSWVGPDDPWPTDVPQPRRTFTEPIELRNPALAGLPGTYILTVDPGADREADFFASFADRAEARGWEVTVMTADHTPYNSVPEALVELLRRIAAGG